MIRTPDLDRVKVGFGKVGFVLVGLVLVSLAFGGFGFSECNNSIRLEEEEEGEEIRFQSLVLRSKAEAKTELYIGNSFTDKLL